MTGYMATPMPEAIISAAKPSFNLTVVSIGKSLSVMVLGVICRVNAQAFSSGRAFSRRGGGALGTPLAVGGGVPDAPQGTAEKSQSSS